MIKLLLQTIYGERAGEALTQITEVIEREKKAAKTSSRPPTDTCDPLLSANDGPILICYGDSLKSKGELPLRVLGRFLDDRAAFIGGVHILPCFPSTSDDGFAVADYGNIDPALGGWGDVEDIAAGRSVMLDAVVNHCSASHPWFRAFLAGDPRYAGYFIIRDEQFDTGMVVRPRTSPLFSAYATVGGEVQLWTTFSADQIDLNFAEPRVALEVLDILCAYAAHGARYIRLDAVGFIWKESGTSCLNLPRAHALVKLYRWILDRLYPGTALITETNVPEAENRSYFGHGDEAALIYQFPLPPLLLQAFVSGRSDHFMAWLASLAAYKPPAGCTYFNFLASHDGVGLRPTEGWLDDGERAALAAACLARGGYVSYRSGQSGESIPYELNINFMDALSPPDADDRERARRMLAAHAVLFALPGVPAVYIHSLLGSRNWRRGVDLSGIKRRVNREKLDLDQLDIELYNPSSLRSLVFSGMAKLAAARRALPVLNPLAADLTPLPAAPGLIAFKRTAAAAPLAVIVNVGTEAAPFKLEADGVDALSGRFFKRGNIDVEAFEALWIAERR